MDSDDHDDEPPNSHSQETGDSSTDDECTTAEAEEGESQQTGATIKPIDKTSVHKICSGQVIVTLATAIKELLENSIDAGATNIDIHLIEYGSLEIQVIDNGVGVDESNYAALTRKHCTSKLEQFENLSSIETFGFRGEALSSLCALSELSITTRAKTAKSGSRIEYDASGRIVSQTSCARPVGTTVTLKNLFQSLPVRHREFMKNLKREYHKMVGVLYAYCLISSGVRINCTNVEQKGEPPKQVLCIPSVESVKERLISLFGSKQFSTLLEITEESIPEEAPPPVLQEYGLTQAQFAARGYKLMGFVSKPHNGRSACDRQFLFINSRPFESQKIMKIVNHVYHTFSSRHQYPFVLLNILTNQTNVDVNVSPDKRSIFLQNEKLLYSTIKATLMELFMSTNLTFETTMSSVSSAVEYGNNSQSLIFPTTQSSEKSESQSQISSVRNTRNNASPNRSNVFAKQYSTPQNNVKSILTRFRVGPKFNESQSPPHSQISSDSYSSGSQDSNSRTGKNLKGRNVKQPKLFEFISSQKASKMRKLEPEVEVITVTNDENDDLLDTTLLPDENSQSETSQRSDSTTCEYFLENEDEMNDSPLDLDAELECNISISKTQHEQQEIADDSDDSPQSQSPTLSPILTYSQSTTRSLKSLSTHSSEDELLGSQETGDDQDEQEIVLLYDDELDDVPSQTWESQSSQELRIHLKLNLEQLRNKLLEMKKAAAERLKESEEAIRVRTFRAKLTPGESSAAEQELKKELSKEMFKQMEILGQFNLGFIITRHHADMFIIDQHASDEKFNFETLEKSPFLHSQTLIHPKPLRLPAISENVLIDNLEIFRKNGFELEINQDEVPTNRIKLTRVPYSKSHQFGSEEIEELIFMLEDAPEKSFCRPTKVRDMLASRACRKSIMIGTALGEKEMIEIVHHLAELDQPWNCPHGRPTLRHLFNLYMMPDNDTVQFNH